MLFYVCYHLGEFSIKGVKYYMKLRKFFVGLTLSISMVVSGCSLLPGRSNKKDDSSLIPTQPANNGVGQNVEPYAGNPNRTVGQIQNTPVSSYKPATMSKIASFVELIHGTASDEMVDAFADCMLAFNLGDDLACAVCDFVIDSSNMSTTILQEDNYADILVNYYYDALKILNSADFNSAANFFTELNRIYREMCTKDSYYDVENISIMDFYSASYGYRFLSYAEYVELKNRKNDFNNATLNELISAYDSVYNSFHFSQSQIDRYESAMAARREEAENMIVVPEFLISFIRKHAADSKQMLINKLKLVVDAAGEFAPLVADMVRKTSGDSGSSYRNYLDVYTTNGYGVTLYENNGTSNNAQTEYTIRDYAAKFLEKRQIVLGLAKAILADEQFGNLLVDAAIEVILPQLREIFSDSGNNSALFSRLNTKLNSLSGKHIAALASFALNLINQIYDDDIIDFIAYYYGESEKGFDGFAFGDKYIDKLTEAVAALSATDKSLITELVEVFGFDLFAEISKFTKIYKEKNVSTDQGKEAFYEALSELWEEISDKIYSTVGFSYDDDYYGGDANRYPRVSISLGSITQGATQDGILSSMSITYEDIVWYEEDGYQYETSCYFNGNYSNWNEETQMAAEEYAGLSSAERNSYYGARLYLRSHLAISNMQLSNINTSSCGYCDVECSFVINGINITRTSTVLVFPSGDIPTINKISLYTGDAKYRFSSGSALGPDIYELNDETSFYDDSIGEYVGLTTNKLGWNIYINKASADSQSYYSGYDYSAYVYYVVDPASMANKVTNSSQSLGYYFLGDNDFSNRPAVYANYDCDGLKLYSSQELPFSAISSNLANYTANRKYTITNNGVQFSFIVIDPSNYTDQSYNFSLREEISGEIKQARSMPVDVNISRHYQLKIDDVEYRTNKYSYDYNQTVTNFTYTNNVISFKYNGQTFTFDATRLAQYLAY